MITQEKENEFSVFYEYAMIEEVWNFCSWLANEKGEDWEPLRLKMTEFFTTCLKKEVPATSDGFDEFMTMNLSSWLKSKDALLS